MIEKIHCWFLGYDFEDLWAAIDKLRNANPGEFVELNKREYKAIIKNPHMMPTKYGSQCAAIRKIA